MSVEFTHVPTTSRRHLPQYISQYFGGVDARRLAIESAFRQRGRILLTAGPAAVLGLDKADHRTGVPSHAPTRRIPKAKST